MKLHITMNLVSRLLVQNPSCRNDDFELYREVCVNANPIVEGMNFSSVLKHHTELGIPSFETVTRCRRKIVEKHPELRASDYAVEQRKLQEEKILNLVREE